MTESREIRLKRVLYRSQHRGTQELDLVIGNFAARHLADLDDGQLDRLETLLDANETALFDWISGRESVPAAYDTDVLRLLLNFNHLASFNDRASGT